MEDYGPEPPENGKQAIDIVVKAIAAELNRKPEKAE
jgi:hypothetical protein